jgi:MFS family permease
VFLVRSWHLKNEIPRLSTKNFGFLNWQWRHRKAQGMYSTRTGKPNRLIAFILAALLALMVPVPALADGGASFNGKAATNIWEYDRVNVTAYGFDLFGAATKELSPGDERSIRVSLRNNAPNPVDFRLAARSLSTADARYLEAAYPGKTADDSLLDAIDVTVRYRGTVLYDGTLRGVSTSNLYSSAGVPVGRVPAGRAGTITVDLSLRTAAGNALMDKLCAVEWVFIAAQHTDDTSVELPTEPPDLPVEPPVDQSTEQPTTPSTSTPGNVSVGAAPGSSTYTTVVIIDDAATGTLPDDQTPTTPEASRSGSSDVVIEANPVPQVYGITSTSWALLNLILTIVSGILTLALMARFLLSRNRERQTSDIGISGSSVAVGRWTTSTASAPAATEEKAGAHIGLKGAFGLAGICVVTVSVVLFILTEDTSLPWQWADSWTPWHALLVFIEVALLLFPCNRQTWRSTD